MRTLPVHPSRENACSYTRRKVETAVNISWQNTSEKTAKMVIKKEKKQKWLREHDDKKRNCSKGKKNCSEKESEPTKSNISLLFWKNQHEVLTILPGLDRRRRTARHVQKDTIIRRCGKEEDEEEGTEENRRTDYDCIAPRSIVLTRLHLGVKANCILPRTTVRKIDKKQKGNVWRRNHKPTLRMNEVEWKERRMKEG